VGGYPAGVSPYGCFDMAGNVYNWTSSLYEEYPNRADDGREVQSDIDSARRVLRGGAWTSNPEWVRCAYRDWGNPWYWFDNLGFRLATGLSR